MSKTITPITKTKVDLSKDEKGRELYWTEYAQSKLKGMIILDCQYVSQKECEDLGWYSRPLALKLDNNGGKSFWVIAQSDDEGNDGGALVGGEDIFPTL